MPWSSSTVVPGRDTREVSDGVQTTVPALKTGHPTLAVSHYPREDMGPVSDQAAGMRPAPSLGGFEGERVLIALPPFLECHGPIVSWSTVL